MQQVRACDGGTLAAAAGALLAGDLLGVVLAGDFAARFIDFVEKPDADPIAGGGSAL